MANCERCGKTRKVRSPVHAMCKGCRGAVASAPEVIRQRRSAAWNKYAEANREQLRERGRASDRARAARKNESAQERRREIPEAHVLHGIRQRCRDPKHKDFASYGGRGITVSPLFDGDGGLARFMDEVGRRPSARHQVERIDNYRGYEPGNLKWATPEEQARNKRTTRNITFAGKTMCLLDWGAETGLGHELIRARLDRLGWSVEKALTTPARGRAA